MAATCLALRGAARVDVGRTREGLEDLRSARAAAVTVNAGPELNALVTLLEYRTATLLGRNDLARTVAGWAKRALGGTGEVALLQAWRLSNLGRHRAADAALAPPLDGSTPAVTPWASIEARVVDCHLALVAHQ